MKTQQFVHARAKENVSDFRVPDPTHLAPLLFGALVGTLAVGVMATVAYFIFLNPWWFSIPFCAAVSAELVNKHHRGLEAQKKRSNVTQANVSQSLNEDYALKQAEQAFMQQQQLEETQSILQLEVQEALERAQLAWQDDAPPISPSECATGVMSRGRMIDGTADGQDSIQQALMKAFSGGHEQLDATSPASVRRIYIDLSQ